MLTSTPASMLNQSRNDLRIPNRINLNSSRSNASQFVQTISKSQREVGGPDGFAVVVPDLGAMSGAISHPNLNMYLPGPPTNPT
jgi:hypothetical protein